MDFKRAGEGSEVTGGEKVSLLDEIGIETISHPPPRILAGTKVFHIGDEVSLFWDDNKKGSWQIIGYNADGTWKYQRLKMPEVKPPPTPPYEEISDERLSALVGFTYQGIKQLSDEDRVRFIDGLDDLFCVKCGEEKHEIGRRCPCTYHW